MKPLELALEKVNRYKDLNKLAVELARVGEPIVTSNYQAATEQGKEFITVIEEKPNEVTLTVIGDDVVFREFGTGVDTDQPYPEAADLPPVYPGSWSEEHQRQFVEKGYWYYKGKRLEGTPPTNGMYYAALTMREKMAEIFKELTK